MAATGFRHIPADEISEEQYGRIWRVNLENGDAASLGNHGMESITASETGSNGMRDNVDCWKEVLRYVDGGDA